MKPDLGGFFSNSGKCLCEEKSLKLSFTFQNVVFLRKYEEAWHFLGALSMYQKPIYIITFMTANIPAHFVHHLGPTFHLRMYVFVEM